MPSYSGVWTLSQQFQGRGQGLWPELPGAPTIGTATAGAGNTASITFTAPAFPGVPATLTYTATSTPGCITGTSSSSPVVVSGLTDGTSYTFKVKAQNGGGFGPCSAASNSITANIANSQSYTTAGTYTWVAPAGVTSVAAVAVGGGAGGRGWQSSPNGGRGGSLAYRNNIPVTPGTSYTVIVGAGGAGGVPCGIGTNGGPSSFINTTCVLLAPGGVQRCSTTSAAVGTASFTGGNGGFGNSQVGGGGGGAGGYAGNGGNAGCGAGGNPGNSGSGGAGGGGGGGNYSYPGGNIQRHGNGGFGGGVGLFGQGTNGAGGAAGVGFGSCGGAGGSGTAGSSGSGTLYGGGGRGGGGSMQLDCCGYPVGWVSQCSGGAGGVGAVRIMWPGATRSFPSTNTGTP